MPVEEAQSLKDIKARLKELNTKAYYLLVALTVIYLKAAPTMLLKTALALTVIAAVPPLQDLAGLNSYRGLNGVRWFKFALLWLAFLCTIGWAACSLATPAIGAQNQGPTTPAATQQNKPAQAPPDTEARLKAVEDKADHSLMEKEYIERTQKDTKDFYQTAFYTQLGIFSILAIIIGLVGKFGVDHIVSARLLEASTTLRTDLTTQFAQELQALKNSNANELEKLEAALRSQIAKQIGELETRSAYAFLYAQGLSYGVSGDHKSARTRFREALEIYTRNPTCFTRSNVVPGALADLFRAIRFANTKDFVENARKELEDPLYDKIEDDLPTLAVTFEELAPVLRERKPAKRTTKEAGSHQEQKSS